jgi:hypothetical protein
MEPPESDDKHAVSMVGWLKMWHANRTTMNLFLEA